MRTHLHGQEGDGQETISDLHLLFYTIVLYLLVLLIEETRDKNSRVGLQPIPLLSPSPVPISLLLKCSAAMQLWSEALILWLTS